MKLWGCVLQHELDKVFGDKKMVRSMFVLPIILVLITSLLTTSSDDKVSAASSIYVLNNVSCMQDDEKVVRVEAKTLREFKERCNLLPEDVVVEINETQTVLYYNGTNAASKNAVLACREQLIQENILQSLDDADVISMTGKITIADVNNNMSIGMKLTSLLLPYMLVLSLFQDTSSFSIDAVAGEKERGVFDKIMLTPISPIPFLMGKVVSGTICGLLSSGAYIVVVAVLSFIPALDVFGIQKAQITSSMVGIICVCAMLLSIFFASISILYSLVAKTVAEAKSMRLSLYGVTILLALASMLRVGTLTWVHYMIPIYNICIIMQDVLNATVTAGNYLCMIGSLFGCCVMVLAAMLMVIKRGNVK